jgi:hypothetical protein
MPQQKINYRFIAFALCVALAFLFEGIAAASHADHAGGEDSCPLCLVSQHIKNFPRPFRNLCSHLAVPLGVFLLSAFVFRQFFCYIPVSSVKLKIKMNM